MKLHRLDRFLLAFLLPIGMVCSAHAQCPQKESIGSVVAGSSGNVYLPPAVMFEAMNRNQKGCTNTSRFAQGLIGNYRATVEIAGFHQSVADPVSVTSQGVR